MIRRPTVVSKVLHLPLMFFFLLPQNQREVLPHDRKLAKFYNESPKIPGSLTKNWRAKMCNIWYNYIQLQILTTNEVEK